ncbi:hypothetical protein KKB40_04385 [Patescibacteria group bacterium]|nr:hypothetical protein [Patescibacteria group bacterium]
MTISTTVGCLSMIVLAIFLGIPSALILTPSIKNKQFPSPAGIVALAIVVFLFVYINMLIKAIITVFKYANWNQVFNEALEKVEEVHQGQSLPLQGPSLQTSNSNKKL